MQITLTPEPRTVLRTAGIPETRRVPELDGVRGLAIALVLLWHFSQVLAAEPGSGLAYFTRLFSLGWSGVDLFFVLSGFLVGGILLDQRCSRNYFAAFYVRRVCRIFPLYYAVLVCFGLLLLIPAARHTGALGSLLGEPKPLWSYVLYLQNFLMAKDNTFGAIFMSATWSLAVEEQFYLMAPVLIRFVPVAALPRLLLFLICLGPAFRIAFRWLYPQAGLSGYVLLPCRWDALFLGVLGAFLVRHPACRAWLSARKRHLWLLLAVLGLIYPVYVGTGQDWQSMGIQSLGYSWLAIFYLVLILILYLHREGRSARIFRNETLVWLGQISYGVYLLHQPVIGFAHYFAFGNATAIGGLAAFVVSLLAVGLCLALASISFRFFERPLIEKGHRFKYSV